MQQLTKRTSVRYMLAFLVASILTAGAFTVAQDVNRTEQIPSPQDREITTLRDLNQAYIDIVADVKPAVVTVSTQQVVEAPRRGPFAGDSFFEQFFGPRYRQNPDQQFRRRGLGSGVIVTDKGQILTNNHVIEGADSIFVRLHDGRRFLATVIGSDPKTDIAVLKIDAENLDYVEIGDSDELKVGELVMCIGSPMSENLAYTVTQGIVSAKGRANVGLAEYEDFIQTDAAINPGNSGGPMVNLDGQLVGVNTAIVSRSGGFQGIGFAVPSNMATRVMTSLVSEGRVARGYLGVTIQNVDDAMAEALGLSEPGGALVGDVMPDSPAERAGIEPGDVIVAMEGRNIRTSSQLRSMVASTAPEEDVNFSLLRGDRRMDVQVTLGELPTDRATVPGVTDVEGMLGFSASSLSMELARQYQINPNLSGAVVTSINPNSRAYASGLREGDLIRAIDRTKIESAEDFYEIVREKDRGDTLLLRILRDESGFFIAFQL